VRKVGEILVSSGKLDAKALEEAIEFQKNENQDKKLGEVLVESGVVDSLDLHDALKQQDHLRLSNHSASHESIRVSSDRLDLLVDTIGELVIAQATFSERLLHLELKDAEASRQLRHIEKLSRSLQEASLSLRMMVIRPVFEKMHRLVRDLSKKTGKEIELHLSGADTEIDKSVIDRIGDPLMHMIRNSCDHGLEFSSAERVRAGKSPSGNIYLSARHRSGEVVIEITDDGQGLHKNKILEKAIAKGLIQSHAVLSDAEIWSLIFLPGFSTAETVTDLSGRGVGMDVVKRTVESIRGRIEIESTAGKGSTFRLILPLTLAIIDGLIVGVGQQKYIIPMMQIHEAIRPKKEDLVTAMEVGEAVRVRKQILPLFRLAQVFDIPGIQDPSEGIVLILESNKQSLALLVDRIDQIRQVVIKPVSEGVPKQIAVSGSAILPDGTVGLLIEIHGLMELSLKHSAPRYESTQTSENSDFNETSKEHSP
jgi:two-component system chemotaxis sensor kinase CheA